MDIFSIILCCECFFFFFFPRNQRIVSVLKSPLNYFSADSSTMVHLLMSTLFKSYLACFCHYSCVCQKFLKPTHLCTLFSPVLITLSQLSALDFPCFFTTHHNILFSGMFFTKETENSLQLPCIRLSVTVILLRGGCRTLPECKM